VRIVRKTVLFVRKTVLFDCEKVRIVCEKVLLGCETARIVSEQVRCVGEGAVPGCNAIFAAGRGPKPLQSYFLVHKESAPGYFYCSFSQAGSTGGF
jgi:hypothetical protein